ncbi:MAG: alanine--tRNA ligase [Azospirillum brasilense]|nr:MAG: alanine--tRNA ligase [Azospirillum brasilense]
MPSVTDIRRQFLDYFASKDHRVLPSSSLVPHNDPTLMFANAGMNQFKNIFTGLENPPAPPRAATSQKCVRAGGKHNDLDNVGYTARHHTFFEMLGNFSFGDYFKDGAISHAWELITKVWGIDAERLCVTVYHTDDEAFNLWKKIAGLPDERIIRIATNDNFWAMGDTGPCGPCSEIFYDHGAHIAGGPPGSPDQDGDRFIEIWNLVFMQYEQKDADTRIALPKPSIDTGMGLERLASVLQGVHSNYEIDLFKTLIAASVEHTGNNDGDKQASHRVIADHLRSSAFLIADGVLPSNEGRGYVLRRIMRRAMRHAHILGARDPLMHRLVPTLVNEMGEAYPELKRAQAVISETLKLEEEKFKQTLDRGLKLLDEERASITGGKFSGDAAFKLYDTYGFPLDLTQDILRADNIAVDLDGFNAAMDEQKARARAAWKGSGAAATGAIWFDIKERVGATEFLGYAMDEAEGIVTALLKDGQEVQTLKAGETGELLVNQTPFYGESGGQVGDAGSIRSKAGSATVRDTSKPIDGVHAHHITVESGSLSVGDTVELHVDAARRDRVRANHSATHLLHAALRKKLGEHVTQKGSLVAEDRLRFDITHPKAVTPEEIAAVEAEVNRLVLADSEVTTKLMTPDDAIAAGAMALFGEKYGDEVRVLSMGGDDSGTHFSVELCGGTHVRRTSDIGIFKITSEGSVSSGVRRIEATTGEGVRTYVQEQLEKLAAQLHTLHEENARLATSVKQTPAPAAAIDVAAVQTLPLAALTAHFAATSEQARASIERLQEANKKLTKEAAEAKKQAALGDSGEATVESVGATKLAYQLFPELDAKTLRDLANAAVQKHPDAVNVLLSANEGKANIIIAVGKDAKADAPALVKAAVEAVGGKGGGGRPDFAQGGGPDGDKLDAALAAIKAALA